MLGTAQGQDEVSSGPSSFMVLAYHTTGGQASLARVALVYVAGSVERVVAVFSDEWDSIDADREYLQAIKEDWLRRNPTGEEARRMFSLAEEASAGALRPIGPRRSIDGLVNSLREDLGLADAQVSRVLQSVFSDGSA